MGIPGYIQENSDCSYNIYINTLYCKKHQVRTLVHELRHLAKNHFHCDFMTITEKELDANKINDDSCVFGDGFSSVEFIEDRDNSGYVKSSKQFINAEIRRSCES